MAETVTPRFASASIATTMGTIPRLLENGKNSKKLGPAQILLAIARKMVVKKSIALALKTAKGALSLAIARRV